jgi:hypothetical protein
MKNDVIISKRKSIYEHFPENDSYREYLLSLFETDQSGNPVDELKSLHDVRSALEKRRDLSLPRCIKKCNRLFQSWYLLVFRNHLPASYVDEYDDFSEGRRSTSSTAIITPQQRMSQKRIKSHKTIVNTPDYTGIITDLPRSPVKASSSRSNEKKAKKMRPTLSTPNSSGSMVDLPRLKNDDEDGEMIVPLRRKWTDEETQCVEVRNFIFQVSKKCCY